MNEARRGEAQTIGKQRMRRGSLVEYCCAHRVDKESAIAEVEAEANVLLQAKLLGELGKLGLFLGLQPRVVAVVGHGDNMRMSPMIGDTREVDERASMAFVVGEGWWRRGNCFKWAMMMLAIVTMMEISPATVLGG